MKYQILILCVSLALANALPRQKFGSKRQNDGSILIVGGEEAEPNEIPYQVLIRVTGSQWCGGSILNANHIITAAHCALFPVSSYTVHAGEHNIDSDEATEQVVEVAAEFIHEDYDNGDGTEANDIAIFRLATPLVFNDAVQPIALPRPGHISSGIVQTSGWGALEEGGDSPNVLHKVQVPIVGDAPCEQAYIEDSVFGFRVNGAIQICAGVPEGGKDTCQGDSGGPLTAFDDGEYLAGIVSWGEGCARPNLAGVYTEVASYLEWIQAIID